MYERMLEKIREHVLTLDSLEEWLFVAVNTMKAIVTNSAKGQEQVVLKALECETTQEMQQLYDKVQGLYGREGFSYRNHPNYYYLSSLVARFPERKLTAKDKERIREFYATKDYLLYMR